MITSLYTIYDRTAEDAGPIFEAKNHGIAKRSFFRIIRNVDSVSAGDFRLYYLGDFNSETMELNREMTPIEVDLSVLEVIENEKQAI